jgi:DNA-binding response OmpR family regulator
MAIILLVDDDAALRRAIGRALHKAGHEVLEAPDGVEAMRLVKATPPDIVLTDINMPEMDGIEIVLELGKSGRSVPIVAMSGGGLLPKQLLLGNADALGAAATIEKPFRLEELLETVDRVLRDAAAAGAQPED